MSPPSDDGATTAANKISWATIKTKLTDCFNTWATALNTAIVNAFDTSSSSITGTYTTLASDNARTLQCSGSFTVSLGDASTLAAGWYCNIVNSGSGTITIGRATIGNTLAGVASNITLAPLQATTVVVNQAANGFNLLDCNSLIVDPTDPTKQIRFDASGLTTGVTRVIAVSDQNIRISNLDNSVCDGRLTLTTITPVTTSDVTAATTVYFTPYKGSRAAVYNGSVWDVFTFSELSVAVPATTSTPFDVFLFNNSGTLSIETLNWTNDTTRATALVLQDGVYSKSGALTRRYLGTCRTTTVSGQTEDSLAKRYVWNYYNRVLRNMHVLETTDSWNYTLGTARQANASTANQLDFVIGVSESPVTAEVFAASSNTNANVITTVGIGLDSTTTDSSQLRLNSTYALAGSTGIEYLTKYRAVVAAGRHFLAWLEASTATGTTTWFGDHGAVNMQSGIMGELWG